MLTALILLQLLIPPSFQFFFGNSGGGGGGCGCPCPAPPPIPICAPPPICAQPAPCGSSSYSASYAPAPAPVPSPFYQPGWSPAIPSYSSAASYPSSYSTSFSVAPPPLVLPSSASYVAPISAPTYSMTPQIAIPGPLPPSPIYMATPLPYSISAPVMTDSYDKISIVSSIATTPSYLQSGYAPAAKLYEKQYEEESTLEGMAPPPPPPPPIDIQKDPTTYDYRTSEVVTPSEYYKPAFVPTTSYIEDVSEGSLVDKDGYWTKGTPTTSSNKYGQFETRHNILKRMKTEAIPRTNNTCNSIKLANVMMRAIVDNVSVSKRMIQHATKSAFDGAKFDVFCAIGEFSYSIHSRKYCEVTKQEITCFAFR